MLLIQLIEENPRVKLSQDKWIYSIQEDKKIDANLTYEVLENENGQKRYTSPSKNNYRSKIDEIS